jgi:GxxExxY protein
MLITTPLNKLTAIIIAAAVAVHRALGPGLLQSAYLTCLVFELRRHGLKVEEQRPVPLTYCGIRMDCAYRLDLVVEDVVVVEVKVLERFAPVHSAQDADVLRLTDCPVGLILNFDAAILEEGVKRVLNSRSSRASMLDTAETPDGNVL